MLLKSVTDSRILISITSNKLIKPEWKIRKHTFQGRSTSLRLPKQYSSAGSPLNMSSGSSLPHISPSECIFGGFLPILLFIQRLLISWFPFHISSFLLLLLLLLLFIYIVLSIPPFTQFFFFISFLITLFFILLINLNTNHNGQTITSSGLWRERWTLWIFLGFSLISCLLSYSL